MFCCCYPHGAWNVTASGSDIEKCGRAANFAQSRNYLGKSRSFSAEDCVGG